ncbi:E3 ubiquitin-protein ligase siah-1-like [Danaus plexippus]|uniref:E3 ubiquitin-protein ligase siah-1-like n=1 Tax=Danaus plexippus TaxID=13037 RepID=UPI002AAF2E51|nr:E3 ubiquitin-protein ligase siah-1-like [Danaus plexippus]
MSNRKESIKKSLGLTEYPWSSDDEETLPPCQIATIRPPEVIEPRSTTTLGTSGAGVIPSFIPVRRNQARLEREVFWSLLNNRRTMIPTESSRPSTSSTSTCENPRPTESIDLNSPVSNLQRIFAIKRLTRTLNPNRCPRGNYLNASTISPFSPGVLSPRVTGRLRRRIRPPADRNSVPAVMDEENPPIQDEGDESPEIPLMQTIQDNNDNSGEQENSPSNTTAVGIPEVEEIVDIDAEAEANSQEGTGDDNQEQASDDEEQNDAIDSPPIAVPDEQQASRVVKRKRDNDEIEPTTVKEFNQNLLRLLECPVCLEWMEPPMCQCRRGHLVCGRCRARLAACPVCRTTFSSVRNRAMEAVTELLRYPCRYGCGRETRLRRRGVHEASCAARRYRCPAPPCADRPPLALTDLPQHFQTKHLSMLKVGRKHKFSMKVNTEQHDHWLVMAVRELFHLRVDVDIRTWGVDVYVAYIGPKCNAAKYTYEVTVLGQHNDRKLVYTRATHSDLESSSLNVSRQDCFHLTLDQALNFLRFKNRHCEPDKFLDFVVEINKSEAAVENVRVESDS